MSEQRNPGQAPGSGRWLRARRVLVWIGVALVGTVLVITAAYHLDVATESKEFCGLLCHPNRPEYVTHEVSPHANVECGTCHVGPGLTPKITAKIYGVGELVRFLTNSYDRPIALPVDRLRPARDICEQCHWPGISNPDRLRLIETFAADEQNTESRTSLTMRLARGQADGSAGQGVHWHMANPVQYVATDRLNQRIVWVGLTVGGQQVSYQQQGVQLTPEQLAKLPRRDMDCLDCHNRATHVFAKPEQKLDEALASGGIERTLPFVKREGLKLLSASYPSQDKGVAAMVGLADFYRLQYPNVLSARQQAIDQAVAALQDIYRQTVFPEMNLTWQAYPNNLGHVDFPGCFRCHDGQHVNAQGETIPANCTLCHSVPVAIQAVAPSAAPPIPHRVQGPDTCQVCHGQGPLKPTSAVHGGIPAGSCLTCHKSVPVANVPGIPHVIEGRDTCLTCHDQGKLKPEPVNHQGWPNESCLLCHQAQPAATPVAASPAPAVSHLVAGLTTCLTCHGQAPLKPVSAVHQGISANAPSDTCLACHKSVPLTDVPAVPHRTQGREDCLACHGQSEEENAPENHRGWPKESCLLCHRGS